MRKNIAFGDLVENAFDFLDKAGREFESEPKYSVIHFYAALELFVKARLLHEHWTLIVTKPENADVVKFQKGEFHSVSLTDAQKRLTSIIQQGLTVDEFACFFELGGHRNRMVHFFHKDPHAKKSDIEAIVSQQCRAWFYLHRVLTQKWKAVFSSYQGKIATYDEAMRKQRQYLEAKFAQLNNDIAVARNAGAIFHKCPSCGHCALQENESDISPVLEFKCWVCEFAANGVKIECPECDAEQTLIGEGWHICSECGKQIEPDDVKSFLTSGVVLDKDDLMEGYEANCGTCDGYHCVIQLEDQWFCTNCFDICHHVEECGWCNELNTGDMEFSHSSGCNHCDGKMGWEKED